jgi:hypothetical protein
MRLPIYALLPFVLFQALVTRVTEAPFSSPDAWKAGSIDVGDSLVVTAGKRITRLSRAEIVRGFIADHEGPVVVFQTKRRTVYIGVEDREAGEALLREVGVGAGQRVLSMRLDRSPWRGWWQSMWPSEGGNRRGRLLAAVVPVVLVMLGLQRFLGWGWWLSSLALMVGWNALKELTRAAGLAVTQVRVGADGFTLERLGRREVVRVQQIAGIARQRKDVLVDLRDGRQLVLSGPNPAASVVLAERLEAVVAAEDPEAPAAADMRVLDRGGRTVQEWLGAVKGAAEKAGDYRNGWLDERDLSAVVGNPRADAEHRIAAAAALSGRVDPEVHRRLRIALDACADEPSRLAISKALDGDLEAAEIEAVIAEQQATRRE